MDLPEFRKIGDVCWSETWCRRDKGIAILRRTVKTIIRAMCRVKLVEKRSSQKVRVLLGLETTFLF